MSVQALGANNESLLERLRRETASAHQRIEASVGLGERIADRTSYARLLARFYGFHAAWRSVAISVVDLGEDRRPMLLDRDLRALGYAHGEVAALPLCRPLMPLDTRADAHGALYVIEGSALGAKTIAAWVHRALGLSASDGCAFFLGSAAAGPARWKQVRASLAATAASPYGDGVVASANRTFERLRTWLAEEAQPA